MPKDANGGTEGQINAHLPVLAAILVALAFASCFGCKPTTVYVDRPEAPNV